MQQLEQGLGPLQATLLLCHLHRRPRVFWGRQEGGRAGQGGVTQPSHHTAFCRGTGDLGLGGTWSWAVSAPHHGCRDLGAFPRAAQMACLQGALGSWHQVLSSSECLRTGIVTLAVLSLFCAPGTVPAPRKPPVNSRSRRNMTSWCSSHFI